ncbi:Phosphoribosylaminoimidazole-succinocarboxamide synthase [Flexistipes sinusarabici DSM 4947]|uniref:Phosphoribosylaminoimidazole-succinocarboxamide synthase n=1 Tax=Flexistipes sinusarabici (strain ATCC 49648 / DSM 4947 / MAS 10) TaxID=717231 RepID=F8E6Y0_FLESM|nr:phosphoribosylaminoimidazolesuccinocarboxamide synthase [Flexistipes sinusarabici]AEI13766.1 Phosphoribosylaminoimidazole-succinocarboxamide synthase [Flexistipes sinusarabici DSM 4947]
MNIVLKTEFTDLDLAARGKVRDIYDLGDKLLIVTTDRISAFDVILPTGIPQKGYVLTQLSKFWFEQTKSIVKNHLITTDVNEMPEECRQYSDILNGRSMLVKKADPFPVECVVRGYITGSGWKDYLRTGKVCGIKLPGNLKESQKLEPPIFTPATKAEIGDHDENISFDKMIEIVGKDNAEKLKELTISIYEFARDLALKKGIIIADTKLEFGVKNGDIILIDEVLTPDSSRFWYEREYEVGKPQNSMDKQFVRNYLETLDWDKRAPGPELPQDVVNKTSEKYMEILNIFNK